MRFILFLIALGVAAAVYWLGAKNNLWTLFGQPREISRYDYVRLTEPEITTEMLAYCKPENFNQIYSVKEAVDGFTLEEANATGCLGSICEFALFEFGYRYVESTAPRHLVVKDGKMAPLDPERDTQPGVRRYRYELADIADPDCIDDVDGRRYFRNRTTDCIKALPITTFSAAHVIRDYYDLPIIRNNETTLYQAGQEIIDSSGSLVARSAHYYVVRDAVGIGKRQTPLCRNKDAANNNKFDFLTKSLIPE